MVFLSLVVFGFSTKPLTMIRLFAELSGHYPGRARGLTTAAPASAVVLAFGCISLTLPLSHKNYGQNTKLPKKDPQETA
jgi:hypothetical protein